MATGQTIIERAMRLIGALDPEESASATELANGLIALNSMVESWQLDRLMIYAYEDVSKVLTAGDGSYSIGPAGEMVASRPVKIMAARILDGGIDLPLNVVNKDSFDGIPLKTTPGEPDTLYYQPSYPSGNILLYPTPGSAVTLKLSVYTQLQSFATLGTVVSLPPGYERAMSFNLAIDFAPEFQKSVSNEVAKIAGDSKSAIKRANNAMINLMSQIDPAFLTGSVGDAQSEFMAG